MKICIAGKNDITVNVIHFLIEEKKINREDVLVLPCDSVKQYDTWQKSVIKCANELGVKIVCLEDLYDIEDLVFVCVQYDRIIKQELFKSRLLYNTHFAYLPKYRGSYTSIVPILNGDEYSGVTIHEIEPGIDTGDIIDQVVFEIDIQDTMKDLYYKYMKYGYDLIVRNIDKLISGNYEKHKQPAIGASITYQKDMKYSFDGVDLNRTSFQIHNKIRAYIFEEYQLPEINGFKIIKSILTDVTIKPKTIEVMPEYLAIAGQDGYLIKAYYET